MKKMMFAATLAALFAVSCAKKEETKTEETVQPTTETVVADSTVVSPTGDTTQVSVDWDGTYAGKLPCASCPGIETTLTLNNDKTYTLEENYLEEKDGKHSEKGTFTWSEDGSFITLNNGEKEGMPKVFFVSEGAVYMAEKVGDRTAKADYKLTKK